MYKQICERLTYPCNVTEVEKKELTLLSGWSLKTGDKVVISANKKIVNPITKEVSYSKIPLCGCTVIEYMGNKFKVKVDEIINDEDYRLIEKYSEESSLSVMMDGSDIESDDSDMSDLEKEKKKQERANKRKAFFKSLGDAFVNNVGMGARK